MENIIWKRMIYHGKDLGDYYLVSDTGEIKNTKTGRIRKKNVNHEGYYFVNISLGSRNNKPSVKVHRAVAETFINNAYNYQFINHIDGNKLNNSINNLEFCTPRYNVEHAIKLNLFNPVECGKLNKRYKTKKIMSIENSKPYDSITDAGLEYNSKNPQNGRRNISRALNHNSTAYGLHWKYV